MEKRSVDEHSLSALELTRAVLKINPEFYTIWNYRRQILLRTLLVPFEETPSEHADLAADPKAEHQTGIACLLMEELVFLQRLLQGWPKCYWLWNHRLWTLEQANVFLSPEDAHVFWEGELKLVRMMLSKDERNFHGWMYRRIVVERIENPAHGKHTSRVKSELEFAKGMIQQATT